MTRCKHVLIEGRDQYWDYDGYEPAVKEKLCGADAKYIQVSPGLPDKPVCVEHADRWAALREIT